MNQKMIMIGHQTISNNDNGRPKPVCGDGIINQNSEQCDGLDGLDTNQTCSEKCKIVDDNNGEVPEFGLLAGAAAILGTIGIIMYRRK